MNLALLFEREGHINFKHVWTTPLNSHMFTHDVRMFCFEVLVERVR